jgi:hypothetical protein
MRKTKVQSKRFPRKLKKEIKQTFGDRYKGLLNSQQFVGPRIIGYMNKEKLGFTFKFEGWNIFFLIDDSFGNK